MTFNELDNLYNEEGVQSILQTMGASYLLQDPDDYVYMKQQLVGEWLENG
mgnify:CR=1 FL=1|tara:strand:+ start:1483 stop:1632 length:150 start_codon:yes stop_codon:yes gene_type:complete